MCVRCGVCGKMVWGRLLLALYGARVLSRKSFVRCSCPYSDMCILRCSRFSRRPCVCAFYDFCRVCFCYFVVCCCCFMICFPSFLSTATAFTAVTTAAGADASCAASLLPYLLLLLLLLVVLLLLLFLPTCVPATLTALPLSGSAGNAVHYAQSFQLVSTGDGNFYLHNDVFRMIYA